MSSSSGWPVSWFVVLADRDEQRDVVERVPASARRVASYASGRPWLVGQVPQWQCTIVEVGLNRLVVLGVCPSTTDDLSQRLSRVGGVEDLDGLAAALPGSCHLALAVEDRTRVQGTASGLRRVFQARHGRGTIAADRADVLAALTGAPLDEDWLALGMLRYLPHPLGDRTPWRGIDGVPAGSALQWEADGSARVRRWWTPPEPAASVAEGAPVLREELSRAVALRVEQTSSDAPLGCDLSGGMDSTSLCLLAHHHGADMVALTTHHTDASSADSRWADLAATVMPGLDRMHLGPDDLPRYFAGIDEVHPPTDAPSPLPRGRAVFSRSARLYSRRGVQVHLAGHGGDEVVAAPDAYVHDLFRRDPRTALKHLRGHRARRRWTKAHIVRGLADRSGYSGWLATEADRLTDPEHTSALFGWGAPLRLPPWASRRAVRVVSEALAEAAAGAHSLAPSRGQHTALQRIQEAGNYYRLFCQETDAPCIELPYLDDRVIEACLSVRLAERGDPWQFKPLLTRAMHGIAPAEFLTRTTKDTPALDCYQGLRAHRAQVLDVVAASPLVHHGLVDPAALRAAVLSPQPRQWAALEHSLSCATWQPRTPIITSGATA
ncbi:asparagine synthase-related protein [Streptomyces marispadix]|uniref:asparagine synthase (glutamine-hydrolyzing) n=1 Tax=Streptomyces marispadix TaxID=2922868 RepID=A0ABS9SXN2_9ACTN|nr:asparagine synthase-related protein [Streptomyces marispadix]MCH6161041.1 asparagine synthase-related protein [Streptomyces marispadix]